MAGDLKVFVDSDLAHFFEDGAKVKVMFRDYMWIKKVFSECSGFLKKATKISTFFDETEMEILKTFIGSK